MKKNRQNKIAIIVVLLFGGILFYVGTDGFQAFTAETARVQQLMKDRPQFPNVTLEDSNGQIYSFSEFENKNVFITFMYTNCTTVCILLEMNMGKVYDLIPEPYFDEDIVFLSISFDPEVDDPARLDQYKDYFQSDGETWRMARITNEAELNNLLDEFGVIVIPDGNGDFAHNSAFYFVDKQGTLVNVMDFTDPEAAADTVINLLESEKEE